MFVKTAVLFLAFVVFVNALPAIEYRRPGPNSSNRVGTIIRPVPNPDGTGFLKRESPLRFDTDADVDILKSPPTTSKPPHRTGGSRAPVKPDLDFRIGVPIVHPKRGFFAQLTSYFKQLGRIFTGRDVVDKKITARSVAIDPELLAELQALVNITVTLLRAEGKGDSVNPFQTQIDTLKSEVESGSVPTGELIRAAHSIASSYL